MLCQQIHYERKGSLHEKLKRSMENNTVNLEGKGRMVATSF